MANTQKAAPVPATQSGGNQVAAAADYVTFKNRLTQSVMNRIGQLAEGGITIPKGFNVKNQIYLAFMKLSAMDTRDGKPLLSVVSPQSVANAMLQMSLMGLSLEKNQVAFIQYGNQVQFQIQYQGRVALAKRYGAGDPQAQVIYEGDVFEYNINPKTGKKVIIKHIQKLGNINKDKIIGAWCLIPYANDPSADPKVEIMTMDEIRQSWMQGATKGQSPAHRNFPAEMAKKTVISKACKLFISTSDDTGIYDQTDAVEYQEAAVVDSTEDVNSKTFDLPGIPEAPSAESVKAGAEAEASGELDDDMPAFESQSVQAAPTEPEKITVESPRPASVPAGAADFDDNFFKAE